MRRGAAHFAICGCIAVVMISCTSVPQVHDRNGRAVTLPQSELAQINRLAAGRKDIRHPITKIIMLSSDRAAVTSGRAENNGDPVTGFTIRKRRGQWSIEEGSVFQTTILITS